MLGILFGVVLFLASVGCNQPDLTVQESCTDFVNADVILEIGFMGLCGGNEPNQQPMRVDINIDGLSYNATTQTVTTQYNKKLQY